MLEKPRDFNEQDETYLVPFSIVGAVRIPSEKIIQASQISGGMQKIKQKIFAELNALLQIETYGRIISNETPDKGAKDERLLSGVQTDPSGGEGQKSGS